MAESIISIDTMNGLGSSVNLWSYTGTNRYTIPCDGYVVAKCTAGTIGNKVFIKINDTEIALAIAESTSYGISNGLFVRKGLKVSHDSGDVGSLYFYPIN